MQLLELLTCTWLNFCYLTNLLAVMGSELDFQGPSETRRNTGVVTVSPLSSLSFSPFSRAVGEFLDLRSTLFAFGLLI